MISWPAPRLALNSRGEAWSSSGDPLFLALVQSAFDAMPVGSETEACIAPALAALTDAGLREDLEAVCLTDALEQSPAPAAALTALQALAPRVRWSVATGSSNSPCAVEAGDDGTHRALVESADGGLFDICDTAWTRAVSAPRDCMQRAFTVSRDVRSLQAVLVDGTPSAVFLRVRSIEPLVRPEPGSTVVITYAPRCE